MHYPYVVPNMTNALVLCYPHYFSSKHANIKGIYKHVSNKYFKIDYYYNIITWINYQITIEKASNPWSNIIPSEEQLLVLLAYLPSMASVVRLMNIAKLNNKNQ